MFWIFLIGLAIGLLFHKVRKGYTFWERRNVKFVPPTLFVGNISMFSAKPFAESVCDLYNYFPDSRYIGIYQFLEPTLIIKDPDLIKQIAVKQFEHFVDHQPFITPDVDPIWDRNLFARKGDRWRDMRATLSPSFTSSKMKTMFHLINECAQYFVKYFEENQNDSGISEYEMKDIFTRYTNDVIASTAFGLKCDSLKDRSNQFYLMGKEATNFKGLKALKFFAYSISPTISKLLQIKVISRNVGKYFSNIIKETVETREKNNIKRPDMIHLLIEAKKGRQQEEEDVKVNEGFSSVEEELKVTKRRQITMDDIISQAMIFFLAGFETVSTLQSFMFYEVAVNPDVQEKLRNEFNSISGEITYEKLLSMKYLDMVISETLRKWPPALLTDRIVTKPFTIEPVKADEDPVELPLNTNVWLPIYCLHRDPNNYPEPEKFIPERFSDENKHNINPSTYMPFGIGPRNCIGSRFALLESKLLLYHVLKYFEIVPVEKTHIPMVLSPDELNVASKGGMWLGFKKITQ